ncbi:MAG: hypothetical protein QMD36_05735 [Candidatus Aenigmarchaeota archaeon]|nr:hypothetical protein [Candidatus Aenigmarchaeota archaeon]
MYKPEDVEKIKEEIKKLIADEQLSTITRYLQKDHAIEILLLNHVGLGRWKDAKDFVKSSGKTISDGTWRARQLELTDLGLAEGKHWRGDLSKKFYVATESGHKLATLLLQLYDGFGSYVSKTTPKIKNSDRKISISGETYR